MLLGINAAELTDRGAFDPILDLDTRLFLDPHLLKHSKIEGFENSYEALQKHFARIAKLLTRSKVEGDPFWRAADRLMNWPEVKGLCIGYSSKGTSGSGIGSELRARLLKTAKAIIDAGRDDTEIFELVGLLEPDFGPDRISDMTANIIRENLANFTRITFAGLDVVPDLVFEIDTDTGLPLNPFTGVPILLVPRALLRDLPVALDWSDADRIGYENEELRAQVNHIIGDSWRQAIQSTTKDELRGILLEHPELIGDLVTTYSEKEAQPYDFHEDRAGEYVWYPAATRAVRDFPLALQLSANPTMDEIELLVLTICDKFQDLIENNGLADLLYNADGSPKHESAAQLLFYGICDSYCDANNIMVARESNAGRGPVDFKFGTNKQNSVLVEVKKSTNTSGLKKGIEKQLPQYMNSEGSRRAIYLVIDVGNSKAGLERMKEIANAIAGSSIKIRKIDGNPQPSASKL